MTKRPWEQFEVNCGFGEGDETKRFGPRQETGSSLYQVDTVASVLNQSGKVKVFCCALKGGGLERYSG